MGTRYQDEAVSELTAEAEAERYMAAGYRRISNTYRLVSRIDDPNWEKHRQIATLYQTGSSRASCEDYYRRVISKDKLALPLEIFHRIPNSAGAFTGYCPPLKPKPEPLDQARKINTYEAAWGAIF